MNLGEGEKLKIPRQHKINNNIALHYKNENIPSFDLLSDQPIRYGVLTISMPLIKQDFFVYFFVYCCCCCCCCCRCFCFSVVFVVVVVVVFKTTNGDKIKPIRD